MKHLHKFPYAFKIPIEASECICLSVILIVSVFKTGNSYHPQVFKIFY